MEERLEEVRSELQERIDRNSREQITEFREQITELRTVHGKLEAELAERSKGSSYSFGVLSEQVIRMQVQSEEAVDQCVRWERADVQFGELRGQVAELESDRQRHQQSAEENRSELANVKQGMDEHIDSVKEWFENFNRHFGALTERVARMQMQSEEAVDQYQQWERANVQIGELRELVTELRTAHDKLEAEFVEVDQSVGMAVLDERIGKPSDEAQGAKQCTDRIIAGCSHMHSDLCELRKDHTALDAYTRPTIDTLLTGFADLERFQNRLSKR